MTLIHFLREIAADMLNDQKPSNSVIIRADFYDKKHFMFEIEDNAEGMDETSQENLFKEFYSTKGDKGTGLGLLVVDRILRNHKGKIEIESKLGKGTTFNILLKNKGNKSKEG